MPLPDTLPETVRALNDVVARYRELQRQLTEYLVDVHGGAVRDSVERGDVPLEAEAVLEAIRQQVNLHDDVERFIEAAPGLNAPERRALRGLLQPGAGVFRVTGRAGRLIRAHNLVDDLDHRLVLGHGEPRELQLYRQGTFIFSAVRPLVDGWILVGEPELLPAEEEPYACGLAADLAQRHPRLFFRNPEHLARAREQQRVEHERFVRRFGEPWAVGTARQVEAWLTELSGRAARIPGDLRGADRVALVSHPRAGQFLVTDLHRVLEALEAPHRAARDPHRAALVGLLEDDATPPALFELLEQRGGLSPAVAAALGQPGFDWGRDGGDCLRRLRSPAWDPEAPELPSAVPLPPALKRGLELLRFSEGSD